MTLETNFSILILGLIFLPILITLIPALRRQLQKVACQISPITLVPAAAILGWPLFGISFNPVVDAIALVVGACLLFIVIASALANLVEQNMQKSQ